MAPEEAIQGLVQTGEKVVRLLHGNVGSHKNSSSSVAVATRVIILPSSQLDSWIITCEVAERAGIGRGDGVPTAAVALHLSGHILRWDIRTAPSRCKISYVKYCLPSQIVHQ